METEHRFKKLTVWRKAYLFVLTEEEFIELDEQRKEIGRLLRGLYRSLS